MDKKVINIKWETDRLDDDIFNLYKEIELDMLASELSDFAQPELDKILCINNEKPVEFSNSIIKKPLGSNSNLSVGATIVLLSKHNAPFVIPPDLIKYIQNEIGSKEIFDRYNQTFPTTEELFEKGQELFDIFIQAGYPTQSAYSLVAAAYVECGWNPNKFNVLEMRGKGVAGTANWSGCGEGLFGLTFWKQKEKLIRQLGLDQHATIYQWDKYSVNKLAITDSRISLDENIYNEGPFPNENNKRNCACLFQCTEDIWCNIMKKYIENLSKAGDDDKTPIEYLMYDKEPLGSSNPNDDDHKLLYTSYLFKASAGTAKKFDDVVKIVEKYKSTHKRQASSNNFIPINGFAQQLLIAYMLGQYVSGVKATDINLNEIFPKYGNISISAKISEVMNSAINTATGVINNTTNTVNNIIDEAQQTIDKIKNLFKPGEGEFDILAACDWLKKNSANKSQHVCAKYIRLALEAGGLDTSKRPHWAWQYINYLPTIGFELVEKITANNIKAYTPLPGDIAVYMKGNDPKVPGHICMWTGDRWCSDFKQNNMIVYSSTHEAYIFRYNLSTTDQFKLYAQQQLTTNKA